MSFYASPEQEGAPDRHTVDRVTGDEPEADRG